MSANPDTVDAVIDTAAASTFARHRETILSLESTTSENISWSSWGQAMAESRSS